MIFSSDVSKTGMEKPYVQTEKHTRHKQSVWVVEYGSHYDTEPWEIKGIFTTKKLADKYVTKQVNKGALSSLYHTTEYALNKEIK